MFNDESWKLIYYWGQKVKDQGHNVCVGLQTERSIAAGAAYVSYAGFSPAVMPRSTSNASERHRVFPASLPLVCLLLALYFALL